MSPVQVTTELKADHFRIEVTGTQSEQSYMKEVRERWKALFDHFRELGTHRILILSNVDGNLDTSKMFEIMREPEKMGWDPSFKLAFVELRAQDWRVRKFGENVGFNRGVYSNTFSNEEEALVWLLED